MPTSSQTACQSTGSDQSRGTRGRRPREGTAGATIPGDRADDAGARRARCTSWEVTGQRIDTAGRSHRREGRRRTCPVRQTWGPCSGFDTSCDAGHDICQWDPRRDRQQDRRERRRRLIGRLLTILGLLPFVVPVDPAPADRPVGSHAPRRAARPAEPLPGSGAGDPGRHRRDLASQTRRVQRAKTMGDLLKSIVTGLLIAVAGTMGASELGSTSRRSSPAPASSASRWLRRPVLVRDFLRHLERSSRTSTAWAMSSTSAGQRHSRGRQPAVTRLRDLNGTVWYVPNGAIVRVGHGQELVARGRRRQRRHHVRTWSAPSRCCARSHDRWDDEGLGTSSSAAGGHGVEVFGPEVSHLRVLLKTAPMEQWAAPPYAPRHQAPLRPRGIRDSAPAAGGAAPRRVSERSGPRTDSRHSARRGARRS